MTASMRETRRLRPIREPEKIRFSRGEIASMVAWLVGAAMLVIWAFTL